MALDSILVSVDDMRDKKDPKIVPFKKYFEAVDKIGMIKWIKENIEKRYDRIVVAKISDVAKEMGPTFEISHFTTLYSGLKYVLFQNGIVLGLGVHKDGDRVFIMREKTLEDKLPSSYRHIEDRAIRKAKRDEKCSEDIRAKYDQILKEKDDIKKERMEIRKERDSIYEEILREKNSMEDGFRKERKSLQETIKRLRDESGRRKEKRNYIIEVFKINWKTLEWKLIRQKMAKTEDTLLNAIREFVSTSPEQRFRIEVTDVTGTTEIGVEEGEGEENNTEKFDDQSVIEMPEKRTDVLKIGDDKNGYEQKGF